MNYQPVALLQTSYKVFTLVLATRLHHSLPRAISLSQQGFVPGYKMSKSVMIINAQLTNAAVQHDVSAEKSRRILLLDFRKAYDTVDRDSLYKTMQLFKVKNGLSTSFDASKPARQPYLLCAEASTRHSQWERIFGRGVGLHRSLIILFVECLGLSFQQVTVIRRQEALRLPRQTHLFSAFLNESTQFLAHSRHVTGHRSNTLNNQCGATISNSSVSGASIPLCKRAEEVKQL